MHGARLSLMAHEAAYVTSAENGLYGASQYEIITAAASNIFQNVL